MKITNVASNHRLDINWIFHGFRREQLSQKPQQPKNLIFINAFMAAVEGFQAW